MDEVSQIDALMRGTSGLVLAYANVAIPMIVGLIIHRGRLMQLLLSPLIAAVPGTLIVGIVMGVLVEPLLRELGVASGSLLQVVLGIPIAAAVGYLGGWWLATRRGGAISIHQRGSIVANTWVSSGPRSSRSARPPIRGSAGGPAGATLDPGTPVTIAGMPVAAQDETKHFKLIGTTGTGKTTAISEMLSTALARGDRAVIADPGGGYLGRFYDADRGDVILNPFDPDAVKWDPFREIRNDHDVDQIARSLIPDQEGADRSWSEYARTFFIAVTQQACRAGRTEVGQLYRVLTEAPLKELRILVKGTAAAPFLEEGNERMFGSVRSITSAAVRGLQYIMRQQGVPFSVRDWVREGAAGGRGGVLYLPYQAGEIAALRSMVSAWMRLAVFGAMSCREGDQRLWFIVDELDALGEIDGLKDALARLRKYGGRCVLGFQSIAQVSGTYGNAAAGTIVENCANTLILRCSASERGGTSQFASKLIGEREALHVMRSSTKRTTDWLVSSTTTSEQRSIEPAVMASEIERLPDLEGFLKLASIPDWHRVRLMPVSYPQAARRPRAEGVSVASAGGAAAPAMADAGAPVDPPAATLIAQESPPPPAKRRPRKEPGAGKPGRGARGG
jgi:Type IV secretion-system coupling protein DNA-binding domain